MWLFKNANFDFMNFRRIALIISGSLVVLSILSLLFHKGPKFGIDFRGGTFVELRFEDKTNPEAELNVPINRVRSVFDKLGIQAPEIKHYGSTQEIAVQVDLAENVDNAVMKNILDGLRSEFSEANVIEQRRETVGPKIGGELVVSAIWSILFSMILILIYIMFRFELRFGVGAVVATFHDVVITVGFFSLLEMEISIAVVAALLTIVGYSLNDTIVVFDRIRENLKTLRRSASGYTEVVNRSINETLSRTIITSGTTLLVVIILYFFGGEITKDFAFALICGIVVGTYSSIFIASPILVEWETRKLAKVPVKSK